MFLPEIKLIGEALDICHEINGNNIEPVSSWAKLNHHMLDKIDSSLHFDITCCTYVNYIFMD